MPDNDKKILAEQMKQLRALAHDLSNSLETIVQATYLLGQAHQGDESRRWVQLIERSSQDAVHINQKLREILRSLS